MFVGGAIASGDGVATSLSIQNIKVRTEADDGDNLLVRTPNDVNRIGRGKLQVWTAQDTIGMRRVFIGLTALGKTEQQHNEGAEQRPFHADASQYSSTFNDCGKQKWSTLQRARREGS